jgi:hypothetical protein
MKQGSRNFLVTMPKTQTASRNVYYGNYGAICHLRRDRAYVQVKSTAAQFGFSLSNLSCLNDI